MEWIMARDQWGNTEHDLGKHPRKALMERVGKSSAVKMYVDKKDGRTVHSGYVIGGHWFTLYKVEPLEREVK